MCSDNRMFDQEKAKEFMDRFKAITGQDVQDWSDYEAIKKQDLDTHPMHVGQCVDSCIRAEMSNKLEEGAAQATYLRDLACLLVDLRLAML